MSGKEYLKQIFTSFFVIVTLINVVMTILGCSFKPEQTFGYEAFLMPLLYGALSLIPMAVMYSRKELTIKQLCFRKVLQLISIEAILYMAVFGTEHIKTEPINQTISFGLSVLIIFVVANVISGINNTNDAKKLTRMLKQYQK